MDTNHARYNMVHQQVQTWDVSNSKILDLMLSIPRERFVPKLYQHLAFSDISIPIGFEQSMLAPKIVGRLLQALALKPEDTVLEIGTGTGYITALLSRLVKKTISVEIIPELSATATETLSSLGLHNVQLEVGDGIKGWPNLAPYNAIIYTGSLPFLPEGLARQMSKTGKIFAVLGSDTPMTASLFTYTKEAALQKQTLFETNIPPLINAPVLDEFKF